MVRNFITNYAVKRLRGMSHTLAQLGGDLYYCDASTYAASRRMSAHGPLGGVKRHQLPHYSIIRPLYGAGGLIYPSESRADLAIPPYLPSAQLRTAPTKSPIPRSYLGSLCEPPSAYAPTETRHVSIGIWSPILEWRARPGEIIIIIA